MQAYTSRGIIAYTSDKPERRGEARGREYFTFTLQEDGTRSLHTRAEIDDKPAVWRDFLMVMENDYRPRHAMLRLFVGGAEEGTAQIRFTDTEAFCDRYAGGKCHRQKLALKSPLRWLVAHPIYGDGLCLSLYDLKKGPGREFFPDLMLTSPDHRGATGPELYPMGFGIEYVGEEKVTVGAGTFDALHFKFVGTEQLPEEHPPYDIWCTRDGEYRFLKAHVGGYMQTAYELIELDIYPYPHKPAA